MPLCVTFGAGFEIGARGVAGRGLGETEVQHLHRAVRRDLDVRRLQVAMDDAALVGEVERPCDLSRDVQGVIYFRPRRARLPSRRRRPARALG